MKRLLSRGLFILFLVILMAGIFPNGTEAEEQINIIDTDQMFWAGMSIDLIEGIVNRLENKYPDFYHIKQSVYYQQLDKTTDYDDALTIVWQASGAEEDYINPIVVLVTVGESLGWNPPPDGDLYHKAKNIRLTLLEYVLEFHHNPDIPSQNPEIGNAATYAIITFFNSDEEQISNWKSSYDYFTQTDQNLSVIRSALESFPLADPIIERSPLDLDRIPDPHVRVNSFFDHDLPDYTDDNSIYRFDGFLSEEDNTSGVSWYSGHDAIDYHYAGLPVYSVNGGYVINCNEELGALVIKHTRYRDNDGWSTYYLHMKDLSIPPDDQGDPVSCARVYLVQPAITKGYELGTAWDVGSSGGAHLHFGVRYSTHSNEDIDPFGWWSRNPDPWETNSGLKSAWLWYGDESGDGHFVVDTNESQSQLFQNNSAFGTDREKSKWFYVDRGYNEESVYALLEHVNESTEYSKNWGIWGTYVTIPGDYEVQAYWPADPPDDGEEPTTAAEYNIYREIDGELIVAEAVADQTSPADQWVTLGEYYFERGSTVVILTDVTDDFDQVGKRVYFDAIRWNYIFPTPTPPTPTPPPGTTITVQVDQGNEDAGIQPNLNCAFLTYDNEIYIGKCNNGSLITSGFRFGNVPIPPGAQIQEAYLEFTVDGTYTLPVSVLISGEDSGDAQPFSVLNQPADRPQTSAGAVWDIPASEAWYVGDIHHGPEMKAVVQEIVDRPDWASGQGMAFILDTLSSDPGHRRVIGYERPITTLNNYPGTEHAARLVVNFVEGTPPTPTPPTPTPPTPTPPTPTPPTPTPPTPTPPTPTPEPGPICFLTGNSSAKSTSSLKTDEIPLDDGTPTIDTRSISERLVQAVDLAEFAQLLYRVRDEYLSQTEEGQHYIALFEEHTTEIAYILFDDPDLYQQGYDVIKSFEAHLQALVDGEGGTVTITSEQVSDLEAILDGVAAKASPDLLSAIQAERENHPLEELIGLSMEQAWDHLNGVNLNQVILVWLPPVSKADPYQAKAGSTIPLKFRIETLEGEFVEDQSVLLKVVNEAGVEVLGPFGLGDTPSQGITIQGKQYHLNLETKDLEPGLYTVEVYYSTVEPGEPAVWNLDLTDKK